MAHSKENGKTLSNFAREKVPKTSLVASARSGVIPYGALRHVVPLKQLRGRHMDQIAVFLLKVAALEAVRRLSKVTCPVVWRVVQALQVLGFPPFKWIQRWGPLGIIVKAVQTFARPFLCVSIAAAFFQHSDTSDGEDNNVDDHRADLESPNEPSKSDMGKSNESEYTSKNVVSENWLQTIPKELEKEGISLPERINADELRSFYIATKGDRSSFLSSVKRTIRWRETYRLLSSEELENWSTLVFWHGCDVMHRPCLIIRLGFACSTLPYHERRRFSQAVVSQIEYGVLHLVNEADPRITVLMDCEGLTPMRFPMQMMKSCATILQDHYPNRLAILFIVRLPAVSRLITQTFMKVLKPSTRKKLRIEGETYLKVLSELLQAVPAFLGGECACSKCLHLAGKTSNLVIKDTSMPEATDDLRYYEPSGNDFPVAQTMPTSNCKCYLRAAVLGILLLCILIAFMAGIYDPSLLVHL